MPAKVCTEMTLLATPGTPYLPATHRPAHLTHAHTFTHIHTPIQTNKRISTCTHHNSRVNPFLRCDVNPPHHCRNDSLVGVARRKTGGRGGAGRSGAGWGEAGRARWGGGSHLGVGGAAGPQISGRQGRGVISHPLTVPVVVCRSSRGPYTWCPDLPRPAPPSRPGVAITTTDYTLHFGVETLLIKCTSHGKRAAPQLLPCPPATLLW